MAGLVRFLLVLLVALVSPFSFAKPAVGCEGMLRNVVPLGGNVAVPEVEAINQASWERLTKYTADSSVQDQLSVIRTFGYVAIRNEEVVGFVVVERGTKYLNIKSIAVAPNFQLQGVGRDLMEKVIDEAKKISSIQDVRVLVAVSDSVAKTFFSKVGLKETEVISGKFDRQRESGALLKLAVGRPSTESIQPQLKLQPMPQKAPKKLGVTLIEATYEELLRIDPTLRNSR